MFTYLLPVSGSHYKIVLGKKFTKLNSIKKRFNVRIQFNNPEPDRNRPDHYFVIQGNEKDVNLCTIEIQRLVIISMGNLLTEFEDKDHIPHTPPPPASPDYSPPNNLNN